MNVLYKSLLIFLLPINIFPQWEWQSSDKLNIVFNKFLEIKKITIFFFIVILVCSEVNSQTGKAKSLEVGNKWVYLITSWEGQAYEYRQVISDTVFNETNYAVIYVYRGGVEFPYNAYERADSIKLFRYSTQYGFETTLIDYSLNVGDSLNGYVVTSKHYVTIWEESFIKMCMFYNFPGLIWYDKCFIEEIGLTWEEGDGLAINGYTYELKVALIEGEVFGDTTLLNIERSDQPTPNKYIIYQNYPNPFNPTTSIKYAISSSQFVTIKVYDLLGRELATLINEEKPAGTYEVEFSVGQNSILSLSSGIYFYQLRAGDFVETKKMVLLR
ncbi:T9SS type A sorting domain-containing protein [Bacteroidota bacterium]